MSTVQEHAPHVHARELALLGRVPLAGQQHGVAVAGVRHKACAARRGRRECQALLGAGQVRWARRAAGAGGAPDALVAEPNTLAASPYAAFAGRAASTAAEPCTGAQPYPSAAARRHGAAGGPIGPPPQPPRGAGSHRSQRQHAAAGHLLASLRLGDDPLGHRGGSLADSAAAQLRGQRGLGGHHRGRHERSHSSGTAREFPRGAQRRFFPRDMPVQHAPPGFAPTPTARASVPAACFADAQRACASLAA